MLKKLIPISLLAATLAITAVLPAAATEEDAAAPAGSFTSGMDIPMRHNAWHGFRFHRHHARMERRHHFG